METLTAKKTGEKKNGNAQNKGIAGTNGQKSNLPVKVEKENTGVKTAEQAVTEVEPVQEVVKDVETVQEVETIVKPVATPEPQLTLEQKIEKIENLKILIGKREVLETSRKKLNSFVVGANQFSENIVLTDENGNTFRTSNSEVFANVVKTINETLVSKITEIEQQIEF